MFLNLERILLLGGKGISAIQLVKGLDAFATAGFSDDYSPSRGCDPMTYETFKGIYNAELYKVHYI